MFAQSSPCPPPPPPPPPNAPSQPPQRTAIQQAPPPQAPFSSSGSQGGLAQQPWIEIRDGEHYCTACGKWATPEHLANERHQWRVSCWGTGASQGSAAPCQNQQWAGVSNLAQQPWIEIRDGEHYCIACGRWATPEHLANEKHQSRVSWFGIGASQGSAAPCQNQQWAGVSHLAQQPWIEIRDGEHYCIACGKWATPEHLANEKHQWRVTWWGVETCQTDVAPCQHEDAACCQRQESDGTSSPEPPPHSNVPPSYLVPPEDFELTQWDTWHWDWKCKLCDKWADAGHVESNEHRRHLQTRRRNERAAMPAALRTDWQHRADGKKPCVLLVAEKPSVATAWAQALSTARCPWPWPPQVADATPVYWLVKDSITFEGCAVDWVVTSTNGHMSEDKIAGGLPRQAPDPEFFHAYVHAVPTQEPVHKQLVQLATEADVLLLCLDADNEGEHIANEVVEAVESHMREPATACILRIDFISLGTRPLRAALEHPRAIDANKVDAVAARRELDLKLGHAVTITLGDVAEKLPEGIQLDLREAQRKREPKGKGKGKSVGKARHDTGKGVGTNVDEDEPGAEYVPLLSYGPCQTPALLFCVKQEAEQWASIVQTHQYRVGMELESQKTGERIVVWSDLLCEKDAKTVEQQLLLHCQPKLVSPACDVETPQHTKAGPETSASQNAACSVATASVANVTRQCLQGLERPLPMSTWTLEEVAAAVLGMTPEETINSAQCLYEHGLISYPRTDSSRYSDDFDIDARLREIANSSSELLKDIETYPTFQGSGVVGIQRCAAELLTERMMPREGLEDEDDGHEPITPAINESTYFQKTDRYWYVLLPVYELVVRYFFATLSRNCHVSGCEVQCHTEVKLPFCERWRVRSRRIQERGWFRLFPAVYGKDAGPELAEMVVGDKMEIVGACMKQQPRAPSFTMSKLLERMKSHGIGTDASAFQHIRTLLERGYINCHRQNSSVGNQDNAALLSEEWAEPIDVDSLWHVDGMQRLLVRSEAVGKQLIYWLWRHAQNLVLPSVRADVEAACTAVARGDEVRTRVLDKKLLEFRKQFIEVKELMLTDYPGQTPHKELLQWLSRPDWQMDRATICKDIAAYDLNALARQRAAHVSGRMPKAAAGANGGMHNVFLSDMHVPICQDGSISAIPAKSVQPGAELVSTRGEITKVRRCCYQPAMKVGLIRARLAFKGEEHELVLTEKLSLVATRPPEFRSLLLLATEIQIGDTVATHGGEATVVDVAFIMSQESVIAVDFEDLGCSFYTCAGDLLVEIFSDRADLGPAERLTLLHLRQCDELLKVVADSEEFSECQHAFGRIGMAANHSWQMLVQPDLASHALTSLRASNLLPLRKSHMVVSAKYERAMWSALNSLRHRCNTFQTPQEMEQQPNHWTPVYVPSLVALKEGYVRSTPWAREQTTVLHRLYVPLLSSQREEWRDMRVVAPWDASEYGDDYLSLIEGELLSVKEEQEAGWAYGRCTSREKEGWFPPAYVQDCQKGLSSQLAGASHASHST